MGELLLNLEELDAIHEKIVGNKLKIFNEVLKLCHNKIKKFNTEFKKRDCLFEPPVFILGKPPYNYTELVNYIITSLRNNGLRAEWLSSKKAIYVSWRKDDIDMNQYHNSRAAVATVVSDQSETAPFSIVSVQSSETSTSKKKKKKDDKQPIQHMAMLEYSPGVKDCVPINIKK